MSNNKIRTLQIGNILSLMAVVIVNFLSTYLPINNVTMAEVTFSFPHLLIPAGFTFSIWGILYLLLTAFCIYQATRITNPLTTALDKKTNRQTSTPVSWIEQIGPLFVVSCILNIGWIFSWHYYQISLCLLIILAYFIVVLMIYRHTAPYQIHSTKEMWFVSIPFSVYTGWLTIALLENLSSWLVSINMAGLGIAPVTWACINIVVAVLCALFFRFRYDDRLYPLVVAWALFGITYRQYNSDEINTIVVFAAAGILAAIIAAVIPVRKRFAHQHLPKTTSA